MNQNSILGFHTEQIQCLHFFRVTSLSLTCSVEAISITWKNFPPFEFSNNQDAITVLKVKKSIP